MLTKLGWIKGRGAYIMVPMAIPSFGGMLVVLVFSFVIPILYCLVKEVKFAIKTKTK